MFGLADIHYMNVNDFTTAMWRNAAHFDIPLINFWAATRHLPNGGLLDDLVHMTGDGAGTLIFDEAHLQEYAYSVWNLITLQTLDLLRREVLEG